MLYSELIGASLDYWVAKAENKNVVTHEGDCYFPAGAGFDPEYIYSPSTDWSQGGPIIDAKNIELTYNRKRKHIARIGFDDGITGETKLIAAMRCYLVSIYGDIEAMEKK